MIIVDYNKIPKYQGFSLKNKVARLGWAIVYWMFFRTAVYPAGRYVRIAILKMFGARADWHALVYPTVRIWAPWNLTIGPRSVLGPRVNCYNPAPIVLGRKITISQDVYLCAGGHDISKIILPFVCAPIAIDDYVWVCANAFIKYGVTIGEGAIVGATSSVYKSIEPWTVVGGNPTKFIKRRVLERGKEIGVQ